ncbi:MAG TPA: tRNA adenosine(34) deaminase TadA [Acidobacteria bacterium]|jgi:tRNA(adenine34) deaminase|nr:tRNA adenosine(34) deaminase TadA [Acidobacteriota bacterium]
MSGHERYMREALIEGKIALLAGEVPVGSVVVAADGQIVGRGFNQPIGANDPTAHAEIQALRDAARLLGNYRLNGTTLYVTVEPCPMCAGALIHSRVDRLVYGTHEPKSGAVCSAMRMLDHPALNHRIEIVSGVLEDKCREMIQDFFGEKRRTLKD